MAEKINTTENLAQQDLDRVRSISENIHIDDIQEVLSYGAEAQTRIAEFSENVLGVVKTKDSEAVGELLTSLVAEIKEIDKTAGKKSWFSPFFKGTNKTLAKYNTVEANVDTILKELETRKQQLMEDVVTFDGMYQQNLDYFKELTVYIVAGKERIKSLRKHDLAEAELRAAETGLQDDAQYASDLEERIARFEKKVHDLSLTRMVSLQMGPQIRMIQNNDSQLIERIQSSILNTIPLWKSQIIIGLGLSNVSKAVEAQRAVTDMTNQLLRHNSELIKDGTVKVAREAERAIIDIETLQVTNANLIETIDQVKQVQAEGVAARLEASKELHRLEEELKNKLLEMKNKE